MATVDRSSILTRAQAKELHIDLHFEETIEVEEGSDSSVEELAQSAMKFLGNQFAYVKKHERPGGAMGRKWNLILVDIREDMMDRFQKVKKLWKHLVANNAVAVRAEIIRFATNYYNNRGNP